MRENLLKKQPTWGLRRAQGTGQKSATPTTLTKVILVLLTMFLIPSAAWGQESFSTKVFQVTGDQSPYTYKWCIGDDESFFWETFFDAAASNVANSGVYCTGQKENGQDVQIYQTAGNFNAPLSFLNTDNEMLATIEFKLAQSRNKSIKAITINLESVSSGVSISACGQNFTSLIEGENTLSLSHPRLWNDNFLITISLPHNSSVKINSISIETGTYLGVAVAGIPVTSDINENDILGDETVSFTAASGTNPAILTLHDATLGTIDESNTQNSYLVSIVSELDALTINLQGENNKLYGTITCSSDNATLAFTGNGSLEISGESSTINGFTSVDFGEFNLASKSAPGIHWEVDERALNGYDGPARDVTITKASYYPIWVYDPTLDVDASYTQLTTNDPFEIRTKTQETIGTVKFDGKHTITLNSINNFNYGNAMIVVGPSIQALTVQLNGESTASHDIIVLQLWDKTPVTFTTDVDNPGSLTVTNSSIVSWTTVKGGEITYENGLGKDKDTKNGTETISVTWPRIIIADTKVFGTNENVFSEGDNSSKVSFVAADTNTLTLSGANITGAIESNVDLTIVIKGENHISTTSGVSIMTDNAKNTLKLKKGDTDAELVLSTESSDYGIIHGFKTVTLDGLKSTSQSISYDPDELMFKDSENNLISSATISSFLDGEGTSEKPYLITSADDLQSVSRWVNAGILTTEYLQLTEDIDDCSTLTDFEPIGTRGYLFKGLFDGNNKAIKKLSMTTDFSTPFGLFGKVEGGTIKNLTLDECTITGCHTSGDYTGAIVGNLISGSVTNCIVKNSTIKAKENTYNPYVGGIVGRIDGGEITQCEANGITVTAITNYNGSGSEVAVGGIVGYGSGGTVNACKVTGESKITGSNTISGSKVGAVIGKISGATLTGNFYEYDTEVYAKSHDTNDNNDYEKDYSGYDHRGSGCDAKVVTDPTGAVMYTKNVIIPATLAESIWLGLEHSYYNKTTAEGNTIFSVAPEENIEILLGGYVAKGTYTLDGETKTVELTNTEYDYYTFTMPDADVTFTVQAVAEVSMEGEQTYATYYNPNEDMAVPMGMTAYIVTGISEDGTKVTVSPVSYIKAGVAVLVEKDKTTEVSETTDFSGSKMAYSDPDTPAKPSATDKWYVIYNNKFVKVTTGTEVSGGKCYLNLNGTSSSGTRSYYDIDGSDGTTALREVKSEGVKGEKLADGAWHDLQGRKFTTKPTKPGLYILNGKKVVIK